LNSKPLVTVLINCRNEERFISRSINSVLSQTYRNIELLIWDDASNDNTVKIIKSFNDERIKFFSNNNHLGLGPSRCKAQDKINGELVAILDADDEMSNTRIEKQVNEFFKNKNLTLVGSWVRYRDADGKTIKEGFFKKIHHNIFATSKEIREKMLWRNIFVHSSIMYKKENAIKVGWYSTKLEYSQDYDLSLKLIKHSDSKIMSERLTFVTIRKESMSQSNDLKKIRLIECLNILEKCKSDYKMNKRLSFLNSREISLNRLKLDLISELNLIIKFYRLLKTFINYPSLIFLRHRNK